MITSIEAEVEANGALHGTLYFEGDQTEVTRKFRKHGSLASATQIVSGITKQPETVIRFLEWPGRQGVRDIHELIVDHGANEFAHREWQTRVYPTVAGRLAPFK